MRALLLAATAAASLAGPVLAHAATFSFTTLDDPRDPTFNQLLGINDAGVITGYFGSGAVGHPNKGYIIAPPYKTFNGDNVPNSVQTQATGLNAALATSGFWSNTNLGGGDANFGFIRFRNQGGGFTFQPVNDPQTTSNPPVNQVLGINKNNNAVGFYNDAAGNPHGFAFLSSTAKFTAITFPNSIGTAATGINDHNLISGFWINSHKVTQGFVKPETGGNGTSFHVPGSNNTQLLGVNNSGVVVGFFADGKNIPHGVYYTPANGKWQQVNDPHGAQGTVLNGINNKNQLVGFYIDGAGNNHGMIVKVTP